MPQNAEPQKVHIIRFFYSESPASGISPRHFPSERELSEKELRAFRVADLPRHCFGFSYLLFKERTETNPDGLTAIECEAKERRFYLPPCEILTPEQLAAQCSQGLRKGTVINLKAGGYEKIVQTRTGDLMPLCDNDIVLAGLSPIQLERYLQAS